MASMSYTNKTVAELMSLVDDHKDEFSEQTYIQMCNAMKILHQQSQQPKPPPTFHQSSSMNAQIEMDRHIVQSITQEIESLKSSIDSFRPGKVKNIDKYFVLKRFDYTGPNRTVEMTAFAKQLLEKNTVTTKRYKELLESCKIERTTEEKRKLEIEFYSRQGDLMIAERRLNRNLNPVLIRRTDTIIL